MAFCRLIRSSIAIILASASNSSGDEGGDSEPLTSAHPEINMTEAKSTARNITSLYIPLTRQIHADKINKVIFSLSSMRISYGKYGIKLTNPDTDAKKVMLDPSSQRDGNIGITTHGHTDHTPNSAISGRWICSPITKKMIEFYKPKSRIDDVERYKDEHWDIKLYDAGHCLGSKMAMVKDRDSGEKVLYTGDYNTLSRYCGKARPRKCDKLIIESTYGSKKDIFPDYRSTVREMIAKVRENLEERIRTRILTYSFGKPQEICGILEKAEISFSVDDKIKSINQHIGVKYSNERQKSGVMVARSPGPVREHRIMASGHAMSWGMRRMSGAESAFTLSDHADFSQGLQFVRRCSPEMTYTVFGKTKEFASEIQKLGMRAAPLTRGQSMIENFLHR